MIIFETLNFVKYFEKWLNEELWGSVKGNKKKYNDLANVIWEGDQWFEKWNGMEILNL